MIGVIQKGEKVRRLLQDFKVSGEARGHRRGEENDDVGAKLRDNNNAKSDRRYKKKRKRSKYFVTGW